MSDPITILPHAESDMTIPPVVAIQDRVRDLADQAWRQDDNATYRQLVNLADALKRGIKMTWSMGDLVVTSASTPGVVYTVSCGACNCPAHKPCKHLKLAEVLLDMLDTVADSADMACDPPGDNPLGDDEGDTLPSATVQTLCAPCSNAQTTRLPFPPDVFAKIARARSVRYAL